MEALQILRFDPSKVSIPLFERTELIPIAGQMSSESQGLVRELRDSQLEEASMEGSTHSFFAIIASIPLCDLYSSTA